MNHPLQLGVLGALGRMGKRVCALASKDPRFHLAALIHRENFAQIPWSGLDVVVDFSSPKGSLSILKKAALEKVPVVIGVTGFSSDQISQIKVVSRKIPVFLASNFSPGIFWMKRLVSEISRALPRYDMSILEVHHKAKKDAPSGTAKDIAQLLDGKAKIHSLRVGDIVGEHTVVLAGPFERLEITHRAHSRDVFALGALEAAFWLKRQCPGLYGMEDLFRKNAKA